MTKSSSGCCADAGAGDVALFMSNGPFDGLKERFLAALKSREGKLNVEPARVPHLLGQG